MVMRRTVNAYYVGSTPTLPAKKYKQPLLTCLLMIVACAGCLPKNSTTATPIFSRIGEIDGCDLLRVKVSGMPSQLVLKCKCSCDTATRCKLK